MDKVSAEARSRIMASIRSKNTRPELLLRSELRQAGVRGYRNNARLLPTYQYRTADVVFAGFRLAVFVDGCFWHACPEHYSPPGPQKWKEKIRANVDRDTMTRARLRAEGWTVVAFWEHEVLADAARCAAKVRLALDSCRVSDGRPPL